MLGRLILGPGRRTADPVPADVTLNPDWASNECAAMDRFWLDAQTTQKSTLLSEEDVLGTTPLTAVASMVVCGGCGMDEEEEESGGYGGVVEDDDEGRIEYGFCILNVVL